MRGYLGETVLDSYAETPFAGWDCLDWAQHYIHQYGGIDGVHHKIWVIDQVSRILAGTPVILSVAKWDNGQIEYRFITGEPSEGYTKRTDERMKRGYTVNVGIAP